MTFVESIKKLEYRIPIQFIRDGRIDGYVKLLVIIELFYNMVAHLVEDCQRFPGQAKIAGYLGTCRQTVSKKKQAYGYNSYSITCQDKIRRRDKNKVKIPAVVAFNADLDVYERLIIFDLLAYRGEGVNDISMRQIGQDLGIDRAYVNRYIKALVERGVLAKWLSPMPNAGVRTNCYEILNEPLTKKCIAQVEDQSLANLPNVVNIDNKVQ